jgi:4-hydroxy-tetrahydrodipicolinate synthase
MDAGISAIVVCGTTGEASTMSTEEHLRCVEFAVERVGGRIPVLAGSGSNCTKKAVYLSQKACEFGVDGLLVITPYYNKATPDGLIKHFTCIADSVTRPMLLYNVPSRTGVSIPLSVYASLASHENIVGVKEASGNISEISNLASSMGDDFAIYSGNDDMILPVLSLGGMGVVSVASNILPKEVQSLCDAYFNSEILSARRKQMYLSELISVLFCEVNPIPVKYASMLMNLCRGEMRLPLTPPTEKSKIRIFETLKKYELI